MTAPPQALYDETFRAMRLDRPLVEQFALFSLDMLRGDFGRSTTTGNPVASDLARFFPSTLELATFAILFGIAAGLPLGVVSARFVRRWPDHLARIFSLLGHSVPVFWLGSSAYWSSTRVSTGSVDRGASTSLISTRCRT